MVLAQPLLTFTSDEQLARASVLGLVNNKLHSPFIFFRFRTWVSNGPMTEVTVDAPTRVTQPCMAVKCSHPHSLASKLEASRSQLMVLHLLELECSLSALQKSTMSPEPRFRRSRARPANSLPVFPR